jgi:ferric-dicitrate binding protein FerR (iron transport regulator)
MPDRPQNRKPKSISEQAADWLIAVKGGDMTEEEKLAYVRWLKQSPKHIVSVTQDTGARPKSSRAPSDWRGLEPQCRVS